MPCQFEYQLVEIFSCLKKIWAKMANFTVFKRQNGLS